MASPRVLSLFAPAKRRPTAFWRGNSYSRVVPACKLHMGQKRAQKMSAESRNTDSEVSSTPDSPGKRKKLMRQYDPVTGFRIRTPKTRVEPMEPMEATEGTNSGKAGAVGCSDLDVNSGSSLGTDSGSDSANVRDCGLGASNIRDSNSVDTLDAVETSDSASVPKSASKSSSGPKSSSTSKSPSPAPAPAPSYIIDGPLRKVPPYYFTYLTNCKLRWRDRPLLEVFTSEFRDKDESYYRAAIQAGRVTLNGIPATLDSIVRNGDVISHKTHRHEPPVSSRPIRIVHQDADVLVVDKPAGIPAHPTGRYRFNTVAEILRYEFGITAHPSTRLDRMTSGLMFLAKSARGAQQMSRQLTERAVHKEYFARVVGKFPLETVTADFPLATYEPRLALNVVVSEEDVVDERISRKAAKAAAKAAKMTGKSPDASTGSVDPSKASPALSGKRSRTIFSRISYDAASDTSLVRCIPLTGRTHQLRVHLQHLGHPIANDPIYSNPEVWGPELGRGSVGGSPEVAARLDVYGKTAQAASWASAVGLVAQNGGEVLSGETCSECGAELYTDPGPGDLDLWLHAYRYASKEEEGETGETGKSGENVAESESSVSASSATGSPVKTPAWSYETELPDWAQTMHAPFMELALAEADKCVGSPTAFCVGAVIALDGTVISTGYSRELPGNTHAEQCALEKYYQTTGKREVPKGSVLYTTMEPCSERLSGNEPCVQRILAAGGFQTVFVGVSEPGDFIAENTGRKQLESAGIHYVVIPGFAERAVKIARKGHPQDEEE